METVYSIVVTIGILIAIDILNNIIGNVFKI